MKENIFEKKLPTTLAILIIATSILITSYLIKQGTNLISRASPDITPTNIKISNIKDSSFSISFITPGQTKAFINFGENQDLGNIFYDVRDKESQNQTARFSHYFNITNLKPDTNYFFTIISGGNTFYQNSQQPFQAASAPVIDQEQKNKINITGAVLGTDGRTAEDSLVYLNIQGAQEITTVTDTQGNYQLSFDILRNTDLKNIFNLEPNTQGDITITEQSVNSKITFSYQSNLSIPPVTLSNNYDFSGTLLEENPATQSSELKTPEYNRKPGDIKIISPQEGQTFVDQKPLFRGVALPNKKVTIVIHSTEIRQTVNTDSQGIWTFRPDAPLPPGDHTITVSATDKNGILKTLSQNFIVFAAGSQVTESATPSASITSVSTPTPTPSPTPTPTFMPTPTPTPPAATPSPAPQTNKLPAPGNGDFNVLIVGSSIFTVLGAFLLL